MNDVGRQKCCFEGHGRFGKQEKKGIGCGKAIQWAHTKIPTGRHALKHGTIGNLISNTILIPQ